MPNHDSIHNHSEKLMEEAIIIDRMITRMMHVRLKVTGLTEKDQTAIAVLVAGFIAGRAEQTTENHRTGNELYNMAKVVGRETAAAIQEADRKNG